MEEMTVEDLTISYLESLIIESLVEERKKLGLGSTKRLFELNILEGMLGIRAPRPTRNYVQKEVDISSQFYQNIRNSIYDSMLP